MCECSGTSLKKCCMDINEVKIKRHLSDKNQFAVPEGYFGSLPKRVMERIGDVEAVEGSKPVKHISLFVKYALGAVAACVAGVAMFVLPLDNGTDDSDIMAELQSAVYDEDYSMDVLNYAMVDYDDVYAYLAGPNY